MDTGQNWRVRDGDEKDLESILSLRRVVFREIEEDKLNPSFWKWQFIEGADGRAFIYVTEEGGRVVGHFADVPRRFSIKGSMGFGTLSLDLMVHPDYRRKGIFAAMGRFAVEKVKKANGLFMMAYPIREETIQGLKKIGWKVVTELPVIIYPIRFRGIIDRYLAIPLISHLIGGTLRLFYFILYLPKRKGRTKGIEIEEVREFDEQFDSFSQKALSLNSIMGVRNQRYLAWRYLQHPTRTYTVYRAQKKGEMSGYIILRKVNLLGFNSTIVVDLLVLDVKTLSALVEKGIEYGHREGTDLLGFMVPKLHPYYRDLRRLGFLPSLKTFQLMIYPPSGDRAFLDPKEWYVNWGDTDVI